MGTSLKVVETPRRLHVKYLVGKNAYDCVSVFSEPIRNSDPYKQCLDWSVGHWRFAFNKGREKLSLPWS